MIKSQPSNTIWIRYRSITLVIFLVLILFFIFCYESLPAIQGVIFYLVDCGCLKAENQCSILGKVGFGFVFFGFLKEKKKKKKVFELGQCDCRSCKLEGILCLEFLTIGNGICELEKLQVDFVGKFLFFLLVFHD